MANMEAETTERNKQNDRFTSLTDSDLDMVLIEKDAASTRRTTNDAVKVFCSPVLKEEKTARKL